MLQTPSLALQAKKDVVVKNNDNNKQQIFVQDDKSSIILDSNDKKQRTQKRTVTFKDTVIVRWTISTNDLTQEERIATWYQPNEFKEIRCKVVMLARKVQRDGAQLGKDKRYCTRGLESILSGRAERKLEVRSNVWNAVLFEQDRQFLSNCLDEELLASASQKFSTESQLVAIAVGRMDQKEAEKICNKR